MWMQSLDPLEEGMATHSSILAWRSPWTEEPRRLWSIGSQLDTTEATQLEYMHTKHDIFFVYWYVLEQSLEYDIKQESEVVTLKNKLWGQKLEGNVILKLSGQFC